MYIKYSNNATIHTSIHMSIYIYYDNDVIIIFIYKYGFVCTIHTKKACVYIYIQNVFVSMYCLSIYVFI